MKNKVVVVTGASGALGGAVVRAFLTEEAQVVGTYRDEKRARHVEESVAQLKARLELKQVDLTSQRAVETLFEEVRERHGSVDVLVNCAGGYRGSQKVHETSPIEMDLMFAMNLKTSFLCARTVLPLMLGRGRGRIVNVIAKPALEGQAGAGSYGASKAALLNLSQALAAETRSKGVTVNCVVPSVIDTIANRKAMPDAPHDQWAGAEDIARVILFLASDAAGVVSGAAIPVFGRAG